MSDRLPGPPRPDAYGVDFLYRLTAGAKSPWLGGWHSTLSWPAEEAKQWLRWWLLTCATSATSASSVSTIAPPPGSGVAWTVAGWRLPDLLARVGYARWRFAMESQWDDEWFAIVVGADLGAQEACHLLDAPLTRASQQRVEALRLLGALGGLGLHAP